MKKEYLFVITACCFFIAAAFGLIRGYSPTTDEIPFHTVNGYTTLKTGDFRMNPSSPAWARQWLALPWLVWDLKLDLSSQDWEEAESVPFALTFFYTNNREKADVLLMSARLMNVLLGAGLIVLTFIWSRRLYGWAGGVLSATCVLFTPSVVAHASLATPDLSVTFYSLLFLFALWNMRVNSSKVWYIVAAIAFGLAQSSKFTALLLIPVLFCFQFANRGFWKGLRDSILLMFWGYMTVWITYCREFKPLLWQGVPRVDEKLGMISQIAGNLLPFWREAPVVLQRAALELPIPFPSYLLGIAGIARSHQAPYLHFFNGEWTTDVQWFYYLWVFVIKMTPAFLLLLVVRMLLQRGMDQTVRLRNRLGIILGVLPLGLLVLMTLKDTTAVGMRYVLLAVPLLAIWIGGLVRHPWTRKIGGKAVLGILLMCHAGSTVNAYPHLLSYFNVFVGGPRNAYHYLRGSDIDWGQDLKHLRRLLQREKIDRIVLEYFGTANPDFYGIEYRKLTPEDHSHPKPEVYAVSVNYLEHLAWAVEMEPDIRAGDSIFIYDMRK